MAAPLLLLLLPIRKATIANENLRLRAGSDVALAVVAAAVGGGIGAARGRM